MTNTGTESAQTKRQILESSNRPPSEVITRGEFECQLEIKAKRLAALESRIVHLENKSLNNDNAILSYLSAYDRAVAAEEEPVRSRILQTIARLLLDEI